MKSRKIDKLALAGQILVWNIIVNVLVRLVNVNKVITLITPRETARQVSKGQIRRVVKYVDHILNRTSFLFKKTCLKRSLVLYRFLHRYNCPVDFHIGVHNNDDGVSGHSWLTLDGQVFADSEDKVSEFVPIVRYPIH